MLSKYSILRLFLPLVIVVCSFRASKKTIAFQDSLNRQIIGEWRNIYLRLRINALSNPGKNATVEADSTNWEKVLKIKPIRTYFKDDGTYHSEYPDLRDSIVRRVSGTWVIENDSITMSQLSPEKDVYKFHLSITNDRATFTGFIDFNGDGKRDDEYLGIQKKFQ